MDREWLEYWQKVENLDMSNEDDETTDNRIEREKREHLEEAKDLYRSVLSEEN